jgi:hypothetical protein
MENEFHPRRRIGLLFQGGVILALTLTGGYFFVLATRDSSGLDFMLHMLIALVFLTPLPLFAYRFYALLTAYYVLQRSGLQIRWGLRREDIPLNAIEWIRPADELGFRLPLPWLRWPGAFVGSRQVPELGRVEFMAADTAHLILLATPERVFAISPSDLNRFTAVFRQVNELGSLAPLEAQSLYPKVFLGSLWEDRLARQLILAGLGIGLVLLAVVALAIPRLGAIAWTTPGSTAPAERLLLLPVLDGMLWLVDLGFGLFIYRRGEDMRIAAYLLWGSSVVTGMLLLLASLILII